LPAIFRKEILISESLSDSLINISFLKIAGKQGKRHISFLILFEGNVYGQIHVLLTTKTICPLGYTILQTNTRLRGIDRLKKYIIARLVCTPMVGVISHQNGTLQACCICRLDSNIF
jgi:hypothetical protein